jgi:prolyl 4-hydroxylase
MGRTQTLALVVVCVLAAGLVAMLIRAVSHTASVSDSRWAPGRYPSPRRLEKLLSPEECDHLIRLADRSELRASEVYDSDQSKVSKRDRQSEQVWLKANEDPILERLSLAACRLTTKPRENQEDVQIVRYGPGGFYNPHYDACEGDDKHCRSFVSRGGQRYATLLVYLSDDFDGGGTHFPMIEYTALPKKGDAIFFYNTDAEGRLFKDSQHGGMQVGAGNKWIANIWVRHGTFS